MRRLLMLAVMVWCALNGINAQKLAIDKVEENGMRILLSQSTNLYTVRYAGVMQSAANFSLGCILMPDGEELYILYLSLNEGKIQIDKGRRLLIKFSDDSIIELRSDDEIGLSDYTFNVTKYGTEYYVKPYYELTEEQLKELMTKEAVKVRIEYNTDVLDREIKKNKLSDGVSKMYAEIQKALSVEKDIYSDF